MKRLGGACEGISLFFFYNVYKGIKITNYERNIIKRKTSKIS